MNINRLIVGKFRFLIDRGYSYSHIYEKGLFHEFQFRKRGHCISVSYDLHYEYLNFAIKSNTKLLFQTSYDRIMVNCWNEEEKIFSHMLKEIYSLPRNSYSLTQEQFIKLLDLYVGCISTGDG